jgi:hypothetical protein
MDHPFQTIMQYLASFEDEVGGREAQALDSSIKSRLEALGRGECGADERMELCEMLKSHPQWVAVVADSLKRQRGAVDR